MPKCILHVGMHKTGTTSIQSSLKALDDDNFYYARIADRPNHSTSLQCIFGTLNTGAAGRHLGKNGLGRKENAERARADLDASVVDALGRTLVISGEGALRLSAEGLRKLQVYLAERGYDDIEVIAYVRPPYAYVSSAVQQRLKTGAGSSLMIRNSLPQYEAKFAKFDQVFGRDRVRLLKFDPAGFEGKDVVLDFIGRLGIPRASITPIRENESITRLAAQLQFQYLALVDAGLQRPLRGAMGNALCVRLRPLDKTRFRLAPSLLKPYIDSVMPDVAWMEQRLGQPLTEDLADEPGDILSTDDLLTPVPGIDDKLRALLTGAGIALRGDNSETTGDLLSLLAPGNRKPESGSAARPGPGGLQRGECAMAQDERRQARRALAEMRRKLLPGGAEPRRLRRPGPVGRQARPGLERGAARLPLAGDASPDDPTILRLAPSASRPRRDGPPITAAPRPMINPDKNLIVLWSPKSACTTTYVWFSHVSGFLPQVRKYANWPHKHRQEVYDRSAFYCEAAAGDLSGARAVRIIRDPYSRAASIYRHALQTRFAEKALAFYRDGELSPEAGMSFQQFLDFAATLDMAEVDIHFRPQFHPFETTRKLDEVINISKQDLFGALNSFERKAGWVETDFAQFGWLHGLEGKRKAKQEPLQGESLDHVAFTREDAKTGAFPSYAQLLTAEARAKIETIYRVDFDAYRDFL